MARLGILLCSLFVVGAPAVAAPLFPADQFSDLHEELLRHERQFYGVNARPFGLSLDAHVPDANRAAIDDWMATGGHRSIEDHADQHPFELLSRYGEYGDLGFFGGAGVLATSMRYLALKKEGAGADALAEARAAVVRAAESWHVFYVIGGPGVVARGIRRLVPEDPDDPSIPDAARPAVPLFDEDGAPLPEPKNNGTYRADNSGGAVPPGTWMWKDSCSKDQMVGQVLGLVALYEAMVGDPDIDQALVEQLRADARMVAEGLMAVRDITTLGTAIGRGMYDLIIMDADGRATFHHDLNPKSLEKVYAANGSPSFNLFNGLMALGVMKGLWHVAGGDDIEAFIYDDLIGERGVLENLSVDADPKPFDYIYAGVNTNFDNPDMAIVAIFLALYTENDPAVAGPLGTFLEERWWDRPDEPHTAKLAKQPYWHAFYMALTDRGVDPALVQELADLLTAFELGPYWNPRRVNCDEAEIAARECLALDGVTRLTLTHESTRGGWMASAALDPSIRPPSNFDARSNPFAVNGGGGDRLNPGPDLLAAYWMGRFFEMNSAGSANVSPHVRDHRPIPPAPNGGDDAGGADAVAEDVSSASDAPARDDMGAEATPDAGNSPPTDNGEPPSGLDAPASDGGCGGGSPALPLLVLLAVRRRR